MAKIDWKADLNQLALELPKLHKNLFYASEEEQFFNRINALKEKVESIDLLKMVMQIAQIVASLGDAHTAVALPRFNRLPFECYVFPEGIYILSTMPQYADLLHTRILKINGFPIEEVIARLTRIVAHENRSFLRSQLPEYIICADILFGLEIIDDFERITITAENLAGEQLDWVVPTIKYNVWQEASLRQTGQAGKDLPLYRKNRNLFYWSEWIPKKKLLYINYNKCKDMPVFSVQDFSQQLMMDIQVNLDIQKVVIDLRNNGGGNSELFQGFLTWLCDYERLNIRGRLFVIVGRDTFSSGLLNSFYLRFYTKAIFLGEPTGGKPNHNGEVKYLSLNSSGLAIRYSTKYYSLVDDDTLPSLIPDICFEVTFKDYLQNTDPCMEWIEQGGQI